MKRDVAIYAHRGASASTLENTLASFEHALKLGADGIELDVQRSKDGQLFVFHDLDLRRLTGVKRRITDCDAAELAQMRLGAGFLRLFSRKRMPTLEQVLRWADAVSVPLNIELKESLIGHMEPLLALLHNYPLAIGSHVSSFHEELLLDVKAQLPYVETAIIVTKKFDWAQLEHLAHIDAVHAHKKYYRRRYLKAAEQANKPLRFYAIDGSEPYIKNPHPSVIGWITDYPHDVRKNQR